MARDAETDRLKSATIPDMYRPPQNAGGMLTSHFSFADSLRQPAPSLDSEEVKRNHFNLGLAYLGREGSEAAPSFILGGAQAAVRKSLATESDKRKQAEERFALDQMKLALDARLAALDAELAAIDKRIGEIQTRRAQIGQAMEAIADIEQIRRSGRKLDPANDHDAALLRAAGVSADDVNGDDYMSLINARRQALDEEDGDLAGEWNDKMKRRGEIVIERAAVVGAKADIENADTEEARILAERRAATVLGKRELGGAVLASSDSQAGRIAASAAATTEREDRRADSAAYNQSAVALDKAAIIQSSTNEFKPT